MNADPDDAELFSGPALLFGIICNLSLQVLYQVGLALCGLGAALVTADSDRVPVTLLLAIAAALHGVGGYAAVRISGVAPLRHGLLIGTAAILLSAITSIGVAVPLPLLLSQIAAVGCAVAGAYLAWFQLRSHRRTR